MLTFHWRKETFSDDQKQNDWRSYFFWSRNNCCVYSSLRLLFAWKHSSKVQYETTRTNFLFSISHPIDFETRLFIHSRSRVWQAAFLFKVKAIQERIHKVQSYSEIEVVLFAGFVPNLVCWWNKIKINALQSHADVFAWCLLFYCDCNLFGSLREQIHATCPFTFVFTLSSFFCPISPKGSIVYKHFTKYGKFIFLN